MRCGVAQRHERPEPFQPFFRFRSLDGLRLVDDEDRIRLRDDVDRLAGTEFVQLHVNTPCVFACCVERLRVDDHDVNEIVRREILDLIQTFGIVNEKLDWFAVLFLKVVLSDLEGLVDPLADRDARNHHDELGPAVVPVQLVHGLDVRVGLSDASLHLNGQIVPPLKFPRRLDVGIALELADTLQDQLVGQLRNHRHIAPARKCGVSEDGKVPFSLVDQIRTFRVRLTRENTHDRLCRVALEFLMLELKFHGSVPF